MQSVRGTKDLLGREIQLFNQIVAIAKNKSELFGFSEIETPIFEFSEIFERNLGETSDIVSKEVYKFPDRGGNFLTLRPEFTAGVVRAFIANNLDQILPQKLFSYGPIFRYDRPQKGRQRQFHQLNFEMIGAANSYTDAEAIILAAAILQEFGILEELRLDLNSVGSNAVKQAYGAALQEYFTKFKNELSADSLVRLEKNPLRILDSKEAQDIKLVKDAPLMEQFFDDEAKERLDQLQQLLSDAKINYRLNPRLVRGLDYYTSTVFEFIDTDAGSQNTVLAGGRYDDLIFQMSGKKIPAIGFAAGIERLMLKTKLKAQEVRPIFIVYITEAQKLPAFKIANNLRENGIAVQFISEGNFKKQINKANQFKAQTVLIYGESEDQTKTIKVKNFDTGEEQTAGLDQLVLHLKK